MENVFEADSYVAPIDYLISRYIREYDISKANINILLYKGLISKSKYDYFYNLPNDRRKIEVGLLQRDNDKVREGLTKGFHELRHIFYEANNVKDYEILSIKKDAIFLIDRVADITVFKNVVFKEKNTYTSFYRIAGIEFYYYYSAISNSEKLDTKGLGKKGELEHQEYMLDFLMYIFYLAQTNNLKEAISELVSFSDRIIKGMVDIQFYRELNNRSLFRTKFVIQGSRMFLTGLSPKTTIRDLDCSYNIGVLQSLYKILTSLYMKTL